MRPVGPGKGKVQNERAGKEGWVRDPECVVMAGKLVRIKPRMRSWGTDRPRSGRGKPASLVSVISRSLRLVEDGPRNGNVEARSSILGAGVIGSLNQTEGVEPTITRSVLVLKRAANPQSVIYPIFPPR